MTRVGNRGVKGRWLIAGLLSAIAGGASAQAVVYRCPGPPVLYTDALSAKEAADKGCRSIEGAPVTVVSPVRPKAAPATSSASGTQGEVRVDTREQRARDSERRRVLEQELREAEERLKVSQQEYGNGQPERRGDERNYQKYLDRVAELKASITRQESDIQAIKREIAKLPPGSS